MNKITVYVSDDEELSTQWDYEKNDVKPTEVSINAVYKAYWICSKGHRFKKAVRNMASNHICPECKRISTTVFGKPKMMMFWDSEKNTLDPKMISAQSEEYAWWLCPKCGYNWQSQIRTRKNGLCPCCDTNQRIGRGINDVFTVVPELAKDFENELNPNIDPGTLGVGSHERINWKCHVCGYLWTGPIYRRIRYQQDGSIKVGKCPVCAKNRRAIPFAEEYPKLIPLFAAENECSIYDINSYNKNKYLWTCERHGNYPATVRSMLRSIDTGNTGCPYCHGSKVFKDDSLGIIYPDLAKEWSPNNTKTAYEVMPGSKINAEWICENGHTWKASVYTRVSGYGYCKICYPFGKNGQGFAERYPELRKNYETNNSIPFHSLLVSDKEKRNWHCDKGHIFILAPVYINHNGALNCPICSHRIIVSGINDFLTEYPQYALDYDSEKNVLPVDQISPTSSEPTTWFMCSLKHSFQRSIRAHISSQGKCPVCSKRVLSVGSNDLLTIYPQIKYIWDYHKNNKKPEECLDSAYAYYYWTCDNNHSYNARLGTVVENNYECLVCNNTIIQKGHNDLVTTHPELASEWSDTNDMPPDKYSKDSKQVFHWICPKCHGDYTARICDREIGDSLCPYCNGNRLLIGFNDFLSQKPLLAKEWSENNDRTADTVKYFSSYEALWICPSCGGEYCKKVKERELGDNSCPFCNNRKLLIGVNDLSTTNPILAQEWSPNNEKKITEVMETHAFGAKWICPNCNGEYSFPIRDREVGDDNCPYCNDRRLKTGLNDLATTNPELAKEYSKNNEKTATEVMKSRATTALWICPSCGGEYSASIRERELNDDSCPYCNKRRIQKGVNDLQTTNPILAKEWSGNNVKKSCEVQKDCNKGGYWICSTCGGEYWARLCDRHENDDSCPYCNGRKLLAGLNDLQTTDPKLVQEWSPNNSFSPQDVRKHYFVNVKWICPTCGGEYTYNLKDREVGDDSCPYCNDKKVLVGLNDLYTTDPKLAEEWSSKNDKKPSEVMKFSAYQALWICPTCKGEYSASVRDREVDDDCCPFCNDKKVLSGYNSFDIKHSDLLDEWDYVNNYILLNPDEAGDKDTTPVWWICKNNNSHHYTMSIQRRLMYQKRNRESCPYCKGLRVKKRHFV